MSTKPTKIYFIQERAGGPIKIGYSVNPKKRLAEIQTSHPQRLMLLATMDGGRSEELELHRRFGRFRTQGEWFKDDQELLRFIQEKATHEPV